MIETLAVIPARMGSTRLPGKPLLVIQGRELVLRVLDGVRESRMADRVIVATDDRRIADIVETSGGEAMMTPAELPTGSDRVACVSRIIPSRYVINVQGDDPMVCAAVIDPMVGALQADADIELAVLAKKIEDPGEVLRDSIVKIVFDERRRALYFSRSPIPFPRNPGANYYKHIGPYAWRRDALLDFTSSEQTPLERSEGLEMLRVLEKGRAIKCIETDRDSIEIDTTEDVGAFEEYLRKEGDSHAGI
jgi:3-deoxy-manno-octulosonate cytidylyltransferase (CMP-KDO synthetase)